MLKVNLSNDSCLDIICALEDYIEALRQCLPFASLDEERSIKKEIEHCKMTLFKVHKKFMYQKKGGC